MQIVDLNVLLYAVNRDGHHQPAAKRWLERTLSGDETVALRWVVLLEFPADHYQRGSPPALRSSRRR